MEGGVPYDFEEELRCECGLLLMKLTPEGLEVKCRRCKRIRLLPWPPSLGKSPRKKPRSPRSSREQR